MTKWINQTKFIYKSFVIDISLSSLVRLQYELAKKGISISESSNIPLFEYALATVRYDISSYSDETIILYAVAVPTSGTEKCWTRAVKTDSLALIIGW